MGLGGEVGLAKESVWVGSFHQLEQMDNEKRIKMKITSKINQNIFYLSCLHLVCYPMYCLCT